MKALRRPRVCRRCRKISRREEHVARGGCRAVVFDKTELSNIDPGGFSSHTHVCVTVYTPQSRLGVDRYVFFRADTDTDYYRSSRPITDILNRYTCLV